MTGETRTLVRWGGAAAAVAVIGLAWVLWRGATLAENQARVRALAEEQAKAQPGGQRLDQQIAALEKAAQDQGKALEQAAGKLVPTLKAEYQSAELGSAANRVATDLKALRQRAERTRVTLPAALPLESGLDPDETVREVQLAQLALIRGTLDTLMDAGVTRISTLVPGKPMADPSGTYAVLTAELDIETPYETTLAVLQGFLATHRQGLGLRGASIAAGARADAPLRVHLTTSLLVANRAAWKLPLAPPPPTRGVAPAAGTAPAASTTKPAAKPASGGL